MCHFRIKSDKKPNGTKISAVQHVEYINRVLKEPQAAQLVARFGGDNLEMEKDWERMSEFDKDEIIRKKIIREL